MVPGPQFAKGSISNFHSSYRFINRYLLCLGVLFRENILVESEAHADSLLLNTI